MNNKILITLIFVLALSGLIYLRISNKTNVPNTFDVEQLETLGDVYYIIYEQDSQMNKLMEKTPDGKLKEVISSKPHFNEIKYSPNFRYISWVDGTTFQLNILDRITGNTTESIKPVYTHEWNPDSSAVITMGPDCPSKDLGITPNIRLIATTPGISPHSYNVVEIDNPKEPKHVGCFDSYASMFGSSQYGWLDASTVWVNHINGTSTIDYNTLDIVDYAQEKESALIYTPFSGGKTYRLKTFLRNNTEPLIDTPTREFPILKATDITTDLFTSSEYTPIKLDQFGNMYYFHDNCAYKMNIISDDSTKLTCRPDINSLPGISTTPTDTNVITYFGEHYYCDDNGCQQFSLQFDDPNTIATMIFVLPKL